MPINHHGTPPGQQGASALDLSLGELLRTHRMRIGMTQKDLAVASNVADTTISDLERGMNKAPRYDTIRRLIEALLLSDEERDQVETAWRSRQSERKKRKSTGRAVTGAQGFGLADKAETDRVEIMYRDWGDAPTASPLFSRGEELAALRNLVVDERCRVVATIGLRGIGKTNLAVTFARGSQDTLSGRQLAQRFDHVIWRTLIGAPTLNDILRQIIVFVSDQQEVDLPESIDELLEALFSYLHERRCLIILDNFETIMLGGTDIGRYQAGYEDYGKLLRQFAGLPHQSCLLLTSREKPEEIAQLETKSGPLRTLPLSGIDVAGCKAIFERIDDSFKGAEEDWKKLRQQYEGSPLALDLAARHILASYGGNISAFLRSENTLFKDLDNLLHWYFERFSDVQKEVLYWLAIMREPVSLDALKGVLVSPKSRQELPSTLQILQQALPLQRVGEALTLQPVLIEYMSARLIGQIVAEIIDEHIGLLNTHAVMLALAKDYIRDVHRRVFLDPILQSLEASIGLTAREQKLTQLIQQLQRQPMALPGYAAGNFLNLMIHLGIDLTGRDFSRLSIRQAYLRESSLVDVNFTHASFEQSAFTDMFGNVLSVAFSTDPFENAVIAAGTGTGEIRLWRASDGMPLATYTGHTDWVWGLAYSPDCSLLASGGGDCTIRLWDTSSGRHLYIFRGHTKRIRSVAFSLDGRVLASAGEDNRIGLWDIASGELIAFIEGHTHPVREVEFTPDGKTLVSCSDDKTVRVWDVADRAEKLPPLVGHNCPVWSLAISPDGGVIASGGDDSLVFLWDIASGKHIKTLQGHSGWICSLAFSPDGAFLASASADSHIRIWSMTTYETTRVLQGHGNWVNSVRYHHEGAVLASGSHDQTVRLWDTASGNRIATLQGYNNGIRAVSFSPRGDQLATADRSVRLWNPVSGNMEAVLSGHRSYIRALAYSPNDKFIVSGSDDNTCRTWTLPAGRNHRVFSSHSNRVKSVAVSPDGTLIVTGSDDNTVRLWDVETPLARILEGHTNRIRAAAFSPTGLLVGSGSDDSTARLWDVQSAEVLHVLTGHHHRIWSIAFSPDGRLFATGSEDTTVGIWSTETGECLHMLQGHTHPIWAIAFRPDSALLASSSEDGTIRLWDIASGACTHLLSGHTKPTWALTFSPDQLRLASGSHDHTVRIWNSYTGQNLATFTGHQDSVWAVAFNPTGTLLASGSDDGACKVWDVNNKTLVHSLRGARLYEGMNIRGITGLNDAQKVTFMALGAIDE
jgi:WD40 repeat protein/transcriptional regulator with XRE-family HTH domain